jgi:hypothetical protein
MKKIAVFLFLVSIVSNSFAQKKYAENVIVITLDGYRWQEMFGGADEELINNKEVSFDTAELKKKFWAATPGERRKKLMPFMWSTIATQGQLHGNRLYDSKVNVKNRYRFSYPGYNELLTGYPDTLVNSNDKNDNKNTTILEYLHNIPSYKNKVAAFTSWDCFDAIINESRAGMLVSSGFDAVKLNQPVFDLLNDMQSLSPQVFDGVRPDHLTYFMAKEYIKQYKPKVLYLAFDETDDYAHAGRYDFYLNTAHKTDSWIGDLWNTVQQMPEYKGKTTLLILCDHGRGDKVKTEWTSHGTSIEGADEIWLAAIGAGIEPRGEIKTEEQLYQAQLAQTVAYLLGQRFQAKQPIEPAAASIISK